MTGTERSYIIDDLKKKINSTIAPNRSIGATYSLTARDVMPSQGCVPINGVCDVVDQDFAIMAELDLLERTGPPCSPNTTWVFSLGITQDEYERQTEDATLEEAGHALGWWFSSRSVPEGDQHKDAANGIVLGCGNWAVGYGRRLQLSDSSPLAELDIDWLIQKCLCDPKVSLQIFGDSSRHDAYLMRARARMITLLSGPGAVRLVHKGTFGSLLQMYDPERYIEDDGPNRPQDMDKVVVLAWFILALDKPDIRRNAAGKDSAFLNPVQELYRMDDTFRNEIQRMVVSVSSEAEELLRNHMNIHEVLSRFIRNAWRERGQVTIPWSEIEAIIPPSSA